jgi:hypothetical protein
MPKHKWGAPRDYSRPFDQAIKGYWIPFGKCPESIEDLLSNASRVADIFEKNQIVLETLRAYTFQWSSSNENPRGTAAGHEELKGPSHQIRFG